MAIQNLMSLNFLLPGIAHKFDGSKAIRGLRGMPRRVLVVGQAENGKAPTTATWLTTNARADVEGFYGPGSQIAAMFRDARSNAAIDLAVDVLVAPPGAGATAAAGSITYGGAPSMAGNLYLYIEGERLVIGVSAVDTPTTIATRMATSINAVSTLPVTAAASAGVLTLTCKWSGETGNQIDLRTAYYTGDIAPIGLTQTIAPMSGGAGLPDVAALITLLDGRRPTEIAWPFSDSGSMAALEVELLTRWGHEKMTDGQVMTVIRGSEGTVTTWLGPRNCHQVHTLCVVNDLTSPWRTAAMAAAAIESQASIDPAVPFTGVVLKGYKAAKKGDNFLAEQKNALLLAGGSVLEEQDDGTANMLRMVTNYTKAASGAEDPSYRNLNWIKTLSYYRWFVTTEFLTKYRGYKLAEYITEPIPGQKVMTRELGEEIMIGVYGLFIEVALMQHAEHYRKSLIVEVDGANGRLKVQDEPLLVTQHYQTEITSNFIAGSL